MAMGRCRECDELLVGENHQPVAAATGPYACGELMPEGRVVFPMTKRNRPSLAILVAGMLSAMVVLVMPTHACADYSTRLMAKVDAALRSNNNLNGANCYTAAPG